MTAIAGTQGLVKVSAATVAEIDEWDLQTDANLYGTTAFGSSWETKIAGVKKWSGSFKGRWYMGDTNGQLALQNALLGGTSVALTLSSNGTNNYTGTAWIKSDAIKTPVDGTVDITFSFEGSGALSYA